MFLKGFLLFCNEGSWCCQQCLAASPALLFYSGPVKNGWSPRAKTATEVSQQTADSHYYKCFFLFFSPVKWPLECTLPETINSQRFHFTFPPSTCNHIIPPTFNLPMIRQQFLFSLIAFVFQTLGWHFSSSAARQVFWKLNKGRHNLIKDTHILISKILKFILF